MSFPLYYTRGFTAYHFPVIIRSNLPVQQFQQLWYVAVEASQKETFLMHCNWLFSHFLSACRMRPWTRYWPRAVPYSCAMLLNLKVAENSRFVIWAQHSKQPTTLFLFCTRLVCMMKSKLHYVQCRLYFRTKNCAPCRLLGQA